MKKEEKLTTINLLEIYETIQECAIIPNHLLMNDKKEYWESIYKEISTNCKNNYGDLSELKERN